MGARRTRFHGAASVRVCAGGDGRGPTGLKYRSDPWKRSWSSRGPRGRGMTWPSGEGGERRGLRWSLARGGGGTTEEEGSGSPRSGLPEQAQPLYRREGGGERAQSRPAAPQGRATPRGAGARGQDPARRSFASGVPFEPNFNSNSSDGHFTSSRVCMATETGREASSGRKSRWGPTGASLLVPGPAPQAECGVGTGDWPVCGVQPSHPTHQTVPLHCCVMGASSHGRHAARGTRGPPLLLLPAPPCTCAVAASSAGPLRPTRRVLAGRQCPAPVSGARGGVGC